MFRTDKLCIQAPLKTIYGIVDTSQARVIHIHSTKHVHEFDISESLVEEARSNPDTEILSAPFPFSFNSEDNLF